MKIVQYKIPLANEKATDAIFELKKYMKNIDVVSIAIFTRYTLRNLKQKIKYHSIQKPVYSADSKFLHCLTDQVLRNLPKFLYCLFHKNRTNHTAE